ncbi:FBP domain-containing protein [Naasia sp. SYSU D00057]|uniref:FBP domain-containing protein n=1 Tax=Naasia sp. SYSU D00057 TaxID=2817380 RepID=UPI001B31788D|nr:FBP domain-containing protein [Naasia sp. SYSU D00057]
MLPLTEQMLRASLLNASLRERQSLTPPADLDELQWADLDYLGWRDRKYPNLGYAVVELDGSPVGVLLRQAEIKPRTRAQCSWCEDVTLPNDVLFFSAKRSGKAGRNGDTVGTLVCSNFECSANVRRRPALAYIGFDVEAERRRRIQALGEHARNFARNVRDGE